MIRCFLDTNVISEVRTTRPHGAAVAWMVALRPEQIFLSAVTIGQLQDGVELTCRQDAAKDSEIESWLSVLEMSFAFLPMDTACFWEWSRLMAGRPDSLREDAMIAATARIHGFIVAARDEKDFKHLGGDIVNPFKSA